jgi:hypothetical protein
VLALADVFNFLAHKLARLSTWSFPFRFVFSRAFKRFLFRHKRLLSQFSDLPWRLIFS